MGKRIAPYTKQFRKKQKAMVEANKKNRVQRYRSSVFSLPECNDLPDYVTVTVDSEVPINSNRENVAMILNQKAVATHGKIVILAPNQEVIGLLNTPEIVNAISQSEWNVGVVFGGLDSIGLAVSMDMYLLARGLDELIENPFEAVVDIALRLELLGVKLSGKELLGTHRSINVDKGELLVNFGSPNFPSVGN